MIILSYKEGHDPAACLMKDGVVLAAAEEERFNRKKHAPCIFPENAIRFCLKKAGIEEKDVDFVVYSRLKPVETFLKVAGYYLKRRPKTDTEFKYFLSHMKVQVKGVLEEILGRANYQKINKLFPNLPKKIYSFDHHLCHAASSYYYSGFEDSAILTMDGKGEATSLMISHGKGLNIDVKYRKGVLESLGCLYSSVTKFLGFTPNDGEYKFMGLAPYGKINVDVSKIFKATEDDYVVDSDFVQLPFSIEHWERKFGPSRGKESEVEEKHKDFAASFQKVFEEAVIAVVKKAVKLTGSRKLCLAGGVALNVKANKAVWDSGLVDRIFIQPAAGDDGIVLGGAALVYTQKTGKKVEPLTNMYFGPEFSDQEIEDSLKKNNITYIKLDTGDLINKVVELLQDKKVIGWYQGRMEFGPRALGDRTILANPGFAEMKEIVNTKIKYREKFRPFCPSVLEEEAEKYFKNYFYAPYMVTSFSTKDKTVAEKMPAVVHVDDTVRPQIVRKEVNSKYHQLISKFFEKTSIPAVLNTSMNVRGEPIVCTPDDAVNFFIKTYVDGMAMGNYLMLRENQASGVLSPLEDVKTEY